ncbi:MAG: transposase [Rhodanobacter sp.]
MKGSHKSRDPPGPGHVTRRSTDGSPPANHQKPEGLIGENGLPKQLTRLPVKKAPDAEMAGYPGYEKHEPTASAAGNARNGRNHKILQGRFGELPIEVLRDCSGTFEPKPAPKQQTPPGRLRQPDSVAVRP